MTQRVNLTKIMAFIGVSLLSVYVLGADQWEAPAKEKAKKNPVSADEKSLQAGKTLYEKKCQSCHGASGKGDGPVASQLKEHPGDLTAVGDQTDGEIFWKISTGKGVMPAMSKSLSADDRWNIVNYVRSLAKK